MKKDPEQQILDSWQVNAEPWIDVVAGQKIASRRLVTDRAIIEAVTALSPGNVLDIGCGEGWLMRALMQQGIDATGTDAITELLSNAEARGAGRYLQLAYEQISEETVGERFDAVVCNFSLLGEASVDNLIQVIPLLLNPGGYLIVQTLHPEVACGDLSYQDGWREGTWAGIEGGFTKPAPWYFRTLASWRELFTGAGFDIQQQYEPLHPETGLPASLILIGKYTG